MNLTVALRTSGGQSDIVTHVMDREHSRVNKHLGRKRERERVGVRERERVRRSGRECVRESVCV